YLLNRRYAMLRKSNSLLIDKSGERKMSNKTSAVGGTKAKAYINEIGLTRVLAILAVLIVHSTSKVEVMLGADSVMFPVYNYINVLSKIATTTFIFLSAFVLFYTY